MDGTLKKMDRAAVRISQARPHENEGTKRMAEKLRAKR
jgi:hypothetical protein